VTALDVSRSSTEDYVHQQLAVDTPQLSTGPWLPAAIHLPRLSHAMNSLALLLSGGLSLFLRTRKNQNPLEERTAPNANGSLGYEGQPGATRRVTPGGY